MQIVGEPQHQDSAGTVHTIDAWYEPGRRVWVVERLNGAGDPVGLLHVARSRHAALACVAHWRRQHRSVCLVAAIAPPVRRETRGQTAR